MATSTARRAFTTRSSCRAQLPHPPPPNTMPPVSQQQAERALLSKLSTLTPGQLSTLLSAPPGTLPSAPSPQPGGVPPPQSRLRRWTLRLAIALLSLYVGYSAGDELCHVDPWISTLARMKLSHDDQDAEDNLAHAGALPMVARTQNAMFYQAGYPLSHQLLDQSDREALYAMAEETGVVRTYPADDPSDTTPLCWPAHAELPPHLRPAHLVTGPLSRDEALGQIHQVYRDPLTGQLSLLLTFGADTQGFPGAVHGGAIATPYVLVVVRMDPMDDAAAARHEAKLRRARTVKPWEQADGRAHVEPPRDAAGVAAAALATSPATAGGGDGGGDVMSPDAARQDKTRKVWVVARMETATTGALICEATGLFVVPKGVDLKPADWLW
ncbi:uncharacterized protein VDAG_00318 [Verticillium dahliae VdLs.17]|uniref:Thioesterase domain-containing protein n=1 Tax=Verticillium dahliae (strain VdLs.17 / ATCC MYA-4575 / FGSC 10137) TaxID=498257 RepID=G2WRY5_VERDV|nr:uncharacterized protein VDAG_00318 [Verticillium dahliae VdLs.17]EGY13636.1 hypothetical protein VDAG_00318 [Verticillium dahliae VdLs.17]KAH6710092.1 hypothetical protein EV126DRAFT_329581 [Verticillium dahliae]